MCYIESNFSSDNGQRRKKSIILSFGVVIWDAGSDHKQYKRINVKAPQHYNKRAFHHRSPNIIEFIIIYIYREIILLRRNICVYGLCIWKDAFFSRTNHVHVRLSMLILSSGKRPCINYKNAIVTTLALIQIKSAHISMQVSEMRWWS